MQWRLPRQEKWMDIVLASHGAWYDLLLVHHLQACTGAWDGGSIDIYAQCDLNTHHVAQLHEEVPMIKLLWCTPYKIPNLLKLVSKTLMAHLLP